MMKLAPDFTQEIWFTELWGRGGYSLNNYKSNKIKTAILLMLPDQPSQLALFLKNVHK